MASQIKGALAGLEFEMVVPDVQDPDNYDAEPDYSEDRRIRAATWKDFEDEITDFFIGGEFGPTRNELKRALERANEDFLGFTDDNYGSALEDGGLEDWWKENNEDEPFPERGTPEWEKAEEQYREYWYEDAWNSPYIIREWLEYADAATFSSFGEMYSLEWPHINFAGEAGEDLESLADDFGNAVGLEVDTSTDYHGKKKSNTRFTIEPDGSIRGDGAGLEFVSPPLPIDQMIDVLGKVINWAKNRGCETNQSTGLHMNVSVPNYDLENLDYVKLALFVGDDWIADQFGRLGADYADSSMGKIKSAIKVNPDKIPAYLDAMKQGLSKIASNFIHSNRTQKYMSLNVQDNRLEFRSPGGDWLNEDLTKLTNTLLRFVVALDIACDPAKQKKEYDRKLYKLIMSGNPEAKDNTIKYFALYSSGQIPKAALMSHLRQAKMRRTDANKEKSLFGDGQNFIISYNPSEVDYRERKDVVRANSKEEAMREFMKTHPGAVILSATLNKPGSTPILFNRYEISYKDKENGTEQTKVISAKTADEASAIFRQQLGPNAIITDFVEYPHD